MDNFIDNEFHTIEIERKIGYFFKNKALLEQAFTRSSYASEHMGTAYNEVLEFIGDSIIGIIVVKQLITHYQISSIPDEIKATLPFPIKQHFECELDEAELSKLKINLVQRSSLAIATERLNLENHLLMGKSDVLGNIQNQASVKEDLLEAIVGAVAIDCNWDMTILEKLVTDLIDIESVLEYGKNDEEDYEQSLVEWFNKKGEPLIFEDEPCLCKNLKYGVSVNLGINMLNYNAYGYGLTEKGARRMASKRAMEIIRKTSDRKTAIIAAVGKPDLNRAVNQLQELYQKKLIPEPKYTFHKIGISSNGNPEWECSCTIEGLVEYTGGYVCSSKSEAKKYQAFEVINYLIGMNLKSLFIQHGKADNDKVIYREEK